MIRVGPAGWSYPDWEGRVYPRPRPAGFHPLAFIARYVDCVEVNSSFYATPREKDAARWADLVSERGEFRFSAKLERIYTHVPLPEPERMSVLSQEFLEGIEPLRASGRLAALLVQFPYSQQWNESAAERLARIHERFGHLPLVLEVRHLSWYTDPALQAVDELGWSMAQIDLPAAPQHPPPTPPHIGPLGYHRLHGRNAAAWFDRAAGRDDRYDYLYSPTEVKDLAETTRRLSEGREETLVIANNHFSGKAMANALELLAALYGRQPLAPAGLIQAFPHLSALARAEGQGTLF